MALDKCPACSCPDLYPVDGYKNLFECGACEGLVGENIDPLQTNRLVEIGSMQDDWSEEGVQRYFDLTFTLNGEQKRLHGWFDRNTRKVVQYG